MPLILRRVIAALAVAGGVCCLAACQAPADAGRAQRAPLPTPAEADEPPIETEDGSRVLPVLILALGGRQVSEAGETPGVLTVIEDHDGTLADLKQRTVSVEARVSVELHGETAATLAKKSYQLELVDDQQEDRPVPLLGLPAGSDWVLHSCGFDPACLRNVLVYTLGRQLGHYAPRTRFVELFVDDAYHGLYVLIERVRRGDDRVNLPRPARSEADGDISGGYIFKMDLGEGTQTDRVPRDWVSPVSQTVYSYYYPRFNEITAAQKVYLRDHMSRFEALMRSPQWNDPRAGYSRWLHLPSWVDFALIQELSLNPDAYFKSVYLQKWPRTMGDYIAIGPLWDFDLSFGVVDFRDGRNIQSWAHTMNRFGGQPVPYDPPGMSPHVPEYWVRLWSDGAFQGRLKCRWQELRGGSFRTISLETRIDRLHAHVAGALARDWERWKTLPKNSYHGASGTLKEFLRARLAWMDANLPGQCEA